MPLGRPEAVLGVVEDTCYYYVFVAPELLSLLMPPVLDYEKFFAIMDVGIFGGAG